MELNLWPSLHFLFTSYTSFYFGSLKIVLIGIEDDDFDADQNEIFQKNNELIINTKALTKNSDQEKHWNKMVIAFCQMLECNATKDDVLYLL